MYIPETARCVDCYALEFKDEMNRCAAGHWTCAGCACHCRPVEEGLWALPLWELQAEAGSGLGS